MSYFHCFSALIWNVIFRMDQENQKGMELSAKINSATDDANSFVKDIHIINRNTKALLYANREV
jgi:hypothetical protein